MNQNVCFRHFVALRKFFNGHQMGHWPDTAINNCLINNCYYWDIPHSLWMAIKWYFEEAIYCQKQNLKRGNLVQRDETNFQTYHDMPSSLIPVSAPRKLVCPMIMLWMLLKIVSYYPSIPLWSSRVQVYHPSLCPETVGLFHTPAPLTTSYHKTKLQFLEIQSFDKKDRRSHRLRRSSFTIRMRLILSYLELFSTKAQSS